MLVSAWTTCKLWLFSLLVRPQWGAASGWAAGAEGHHHLRVAGSQCFTIVPSSKTAAVGLTYQSPHPNTLHLSTFFHPTQLMVEKYDLCQKMFHLPRPSFFWAWRAGCCAARLLLLLALHLPASPHEDLGSFGSKHVTPLWSAKERKEQLQQPQRARFAMLFWLVCYRDTLMLLYHVMLKWCWCAVHDAAKASWHESLTSDVRLHHWFFPAFWLWNSWSSLFLSIGATPWTHFKYLKQLWHGHGANSPCHFCTGSTMQALALTWRIVETSSRALLRIFQVKRCCFWFWSWLNKLYMEHLRPHVKVQEIEQVKGNQEKTLGNLVCPRLQACRPKPLAPFSWTTGLQCWIPRPLGRYSSVCMSLRCLNAQGT